MNYPRCRCASWCRAASDHSMSAERSEMVAVSTRSLHGPRPTGTAPAAFKTFTSSSVKSDQTWKTAIFETNQVQLNAITSCVQLFSTSGIDKWVNYKKKFYDLATVHYMWVAILHSIKPFCSASASSPYQMKNISACLG